MPLPGFDRGIASRSRVRLVLTSALVAAGLMVVPGMAAQAATPPAGTLNTAFNTTIGVGFDDVVTSVVQLADGSLLVGGDFTHFGTTAVNHLAHLSSAGVLDTAFNATIGAGFSSGVYTMIQLADGSLLIGGEFTSFGTTTVGRLVHLSSAGVLDTTFNTTIGAGFNGSAGCVVQLADGSLVVAGAFTTFGTTTVGGLVHLSSTGVLDTTFNTTIGAGFNAPVLSVAKLADGSLLIGGAFTTFGTTTVGGLVHLSSAGVLDSAFNTAIGAGFDSVVESVVQLADGSFLVGGVFSNFGSTQVGGLAHLSNTGVLDSAFNTAIGAGFDAPVLSAVQLADGDLLLGGVFSHFGITSVGGLALLYGYPIATPTPTPTPSPDAGSSSSLAETGANPLPIVALGVGLLLAAGLLLLARTPADPSAGWLSNHPFLMGHRSAVILR